MLLYTLGSGLDAFSTISVFTVHFYMLSKARSARTVALNRSEYIKTRCYGKQAEINSTLAASVTVTDDTETPDGVQPTAQQMIRIRDNLSLPSCRKQ